MRPWWRKLLWFCWSRERARTAGSWGGWSGPRWRSAPSCWGWSWWGGPSPPSADTQCQPPAKPESYVAGSSLKLAVEATLLDTAIIFTTFTFQYWLQNYTNLWLQNDVNAEFVGVWFRAVVAVDQRDSIEPNQTLAISNSEQSPGKVSCYSLPVQLFQITSQTCDNDDEERFLTRQSLILVQGWRRWGPAWRGWRTWRTWWGSAILLKTPLLPTTRRPTRWHVK